VIQRLLIFAGAATLALPLQVANAQRAFPSIYREQRGIEVRDPSALPAYRIYDVPTPETVSRPQELEERPLALDEAIRISVRNADVVRILSGTSASNSGRTIYDPAITNTTIDEQNSVFDPNLSSSNTWNRLENPSAIFDAMNPGESLITGTRTDSFNSTTGLNKLNAFGGTTEFGVQTNPFRIGPGNFPLNPQRDTATFLQYTQPLLQGGRVRANLAPIVIARINTERSFFQMKDSMQENVRGVVDAYWSLVSARTDVWARRQQVAQLTETVRQIQGGVNAGRLNAASDLAQAQLSLANFQANLISSEANVIQREAALRNLIGLPPADGTRLVPNTPPIREVYDANWDGMVELASERRPDIVELKLILEADQQQLMLSRNSALPRVDAVGLYRWNGLDGVMPNGNPLTSGAGQFTDWTTGVNFSVPIGLRKARAALRRQELIIMRDRVNLNQGLHAAVHTLATNLRALDQVFEQYLAFREARRAAQLNLEKQLASYRTQQAILINVLQAVTDWGNAVASEASSLTQFNTQLANLERQSGTILETHGIFFYEERFNSISPKGRWFKDVPYAMDMRPSENGNNYEDSEKPAEEAFELKPPPNIREIPDLKYEDIELPKIEDELKGIDELMRRRKAEEEPKPESLEEPAPATEALPSPLNEEGNPDDSSKKGGTSSERRKRSRLMSLFDR